MEIEDWYEPQERSLARKHVGPHHRVLEAGAGKGAVTRELAKRAGVVVALEPQTEACASAAQNAPGAFVIQAALGAWGEIVPLYLYDKFWAAGSWSGSVRGEPRERVEVPTVPVRALVAQYRINALVLDVEGYETKIVPEALKDDEIKLMVLELHPDFCNGREYGAMLDAIERAGFACLSWEQDRDTFHACYERA